MFTEGHRSSTEPSHGSTKGSDSSGRAPVRYTYDSECAGGGSGGSNVGDTVKLTNMQATMVIALFKNSIAQSTTEWNVTVFRNTARARALPPPEPVAVNAVLSKEGGSFDRIEVPPSCSYGLITD